MKRIIAFLLLPLLAFTFIACNPDEEEESTTKLVKTVKLEVFKNEEVVQIVSYTYYYDNQNRVIKIETLYWEDTPPYYYESTTNFKYSANTIFVNDSFLYQLDANGYLISDVFGITYIYENGYLKETRNESGDSTKYTWSNGNIVQSFGTYYSMIGDTIYTYTTNYEYTNKENLLNIILPWDSGYEFVGVLLKFKGTANKNLLKKVTNQEGIRLDVTDYQFDEKGYPIQIILNLYSPYPIIQEKQKYTITYY